MKEGEKPRIHAYLARRGLGSRRAIEALVESRKVLVNGVPAKLGQKIDPSKDVIRLKGKQLSIKNPQEARVIALHKPVGVVTTVSDPQGRKTVLDLVPKSARRGRLYPVGRLDLKSEGLLLLTDDGELANRLMHPRYEVPKVYEVKIRGHLDKKKVEHLEKGVRVGGNKMQPAEVLSVIETTQSGVSKYKVKLRVFEGKNHHVRKLFESLGCRVIKLKRLSVGTVSLKGLRIGGFRILSTGQIEKLRKSVGLDEAQKKRARA